MAQLSRAALEAFFETGDKPSESNFVDLIDSCLNFVSDGAPIKVESVTISRTAMAGTGVVQYNVFTFKPKLIIMGARDIPGVDNTSLGIVDGNKQYSIFLRVIGTNGMSFNSVIIVGSNTLDGMFGTLTNILADGFEISWVKFGSGFDVNVDCVGIGF